MKNRRIMTNADMSMTGTTLVSIHFILIHSLHTFDCGDHTLGLWSDGTPDSDQVNKL